MRWKELPQGTKTCKRLNGHWSTTPFCMPSHEQQDFLPQPDHSRAEYKINMRAHVMVSMSLLFTTLAFSQMNDLFPDHDPFAMIPPGVPHICPKWFPHDPCFYKETYPTRCYQRYNWDQMRVYHLAIVKDNGLINASSIEDEAIELTRLQILEEMQGRRHGVRDIDYAQNETTPNSDAHLSSTKNGLFPIDEVDNRPPCCQWTFECWNFFASRPEGYDWSDYWNRQDWLKIGCCYYSWAAKCGGKVPHRPSIIRKPPRCTMPKGHDREP